MIISSFLDTSQINSDDALNLSPRMRVLALSLKLRYENRLDYKEFATDGPNHHFTLNPPFRVETNFFKFYFHAKASSAPNLAEELIKNSFNESQNVNFAFKVTDFPYNMNSSCENRLTAYVNRGHIDSVVKAIRGISRSYFYDGSHKYGYEVCKGVSVLYIGSNSITSSGDLGPDLISTLIRGFQTTRTFEQFFQYVKANLSRKYLHFKLAFKKY